MDWMDGWMDGCLSLEGDVMCAQSRDPAAPARLLRYHLTPRPPKAEDQPEKTDGSGTSGAICPTDWCWMYWMHSRSGTGRYAGYIVHPVMYSSSPWWSIEALNWTELLC
jgi:hypothetical protein